MFDWAHYRPQYRLSRFFNTSAPLLKGLLHDFAPEKDWVVGAVNLLLLAGAWWFRSRVLALAALLAIGGLLPVNFIPPRQTFVLYLPYTGYAIYAAVLLEKVGGGSTGR